MPLCLYFPQFLMFNYGHFSNLVLKEVQHTFSVIESSDYYEYVEIYLPMYDVHKMLNEQSIAKL